MKKERGREREREKGKNIHTTVYFQCKENIYVI